MSDRKRQLEMDITDAQPPEIRALIYEYGYKVVMDCIASSNTRDPERIKKFAEANRRATQERLPDEVAGLGERVLVKSYRRRSF